MSDKIRTHIMLASLSVGMWAGRKNDRVSARKLEKEAGAVNGAASTAKHLMVGVQSHEAIGKYVAMNRVWWTKVTLPWFDGRGAPRAINPAGVIDLQLDLSERECKFYELVDVFMQEYPVMRTHRQFDLGDFFDPKEFPEPSNMRRRFYFIVDFSAIPRADDLRLAEGVSDDTAKAMAKNAAEREAARFEGALNTAAQRLFKVVESMHKTMSVPIGDNGSKFNDTKLENILEIVELMPLLNIANDPKLNDLAKQAKTLATKSPDELRKDAVKRAGAAKEAKALADRLAGAFDVTGDEEDDTPPPVKVAPTPAPKATPKPVPAKVPAPKAKKSLSASLADF